MIVTVKYLASKYGISDSSIRTIVDRAEFAKWRKGGSGGIEFDLNDESREAFNFWVKKKRRYYGYTDGADL